MGGETQNPRTLGAQPQDVGDHRIGVVGLVEHREAAERFGPDFLRLYPAETDAQALDAVLRANRESNLVALRRWAEGRARHARAPTFMYLWRHTLPGPNADIYRAFHSSEAPYVFGSFSAAPHRPFSEQDRAIASTMMAYWSNFVKTGDPNGGALPHWPQASQTNSGFMELGDTMAPLPPVTAAAAVLFSAHYDRAGEFSF